MAGAVVARDAADMFDEVMSAVATVNPEASQELAELESRLGFRLRDDLMATLGGEAAFAVDGPLLPTPSWKVIVEVYDPATLQHTVEQVVVQANQAFTDEGQATRLELSSETVNGHLYHGLGQAGHSPLAYYTVVDGFLVVAPTTAVIEQALQYRSSGLTLTSSALFASLLPSNGYVDCSALSYRNLGAVTDLLPAGAVGSLPPQVLALVEQSAVPSLYCVYGEENRIIVSGTGGSFLSMAPLLSLPAVLDDFGEGGGELGNDTHESPAEVSS